MGDLRANIEIIFDFQGKKYKMDSWINWMDDGDGIDRRVRDFFRDSYEDGMARYNETMRKIYQEDHRKEIEAGEKAELKRLQKKYSPHP